MVRLNLVLSNHSNVSDSCPCQTLSWLQNIFSTKPRKSIETEMQNRVTENWLRIKFFRPKNLYNNNNNNNDNEVQSLK